jgi:hypothetical protein
MKKFARVKGAYRMLGKVGEIGIIYFDGFILKWLKWPHPELVH